MKHQIGDIVHTTVQGFGLEDRMRVIGRVEGVAVTIRDGHGYERTLGSGHDADIQIANTIEERDYWRDRALAAEREGYGVVPGKVAERITTSRSERADAQSAARDAVALSRIANRALLSVGHGYMVHIEQTGPETRLVVDIDGVSLTKLPPGRYVFLPEPE